MKGYTLLEHLLFPRTYLNSRKLASAMKGKTVLITGASSGIGEQLAYLLGRYDVNLMLTARNESRLLAIQSDIESGRSQKAVESPVEAGAGNCDGDGISTASPSLYAQVSVYSADLRVDEELEALLAWVSRQPAQPDIVVSNAGLSIRRSLFDSLERAHDFSRTMAINYIAPVRLLLSLIPQLQRGGGQIINVSTINTALIPFPGWAAYQASKAAFDVWFRAAAPELNASGIATTSVYLPLVRTPMIAPTAAYARAPAMSAEHAARRIAKSLYTKSRLIRPWWLPFGQLASLWGRGLWERIAPSLIRREERRR